MNNCMPTKLDKLNKMEKNLEKHTNYQNRLNKK